MTRLYHACDASDLDAILRDGLRPGAWLTSSPEVADYYAEGIAEDGGTPAVVETGLDELVAAVGEEMVEPDRPGIAEPITRAIGKTEDEVHAEWEACGGSWRDSLEVVQSIRVMAAIPAAILSAPASRPAP